MAIQISASMSKKIPIPGIDYASQHVSITVSGEISDLAQISAESARLFAAAEAQVDRQLKLVTAVHSSAVESSSPAPPQVVTESGRIARPYLSPKRVAPVTDAQLRFIDKLLTGSRSDKAELLRDLKVDSMDQLSCKDAAAVIDDLKSRATRR